MRPQVLRLVTLIAAPQNYRHRRVSQHVAAIHRPTTSVSLRKPKRHAQFRAILLRMWLYRVLAPLTVAVPAALALLAKGPRGPVLATVTIIAGLLLYWFTLPRLAHRAYRQGNVASAARRYRWLAASYVPERRRAALLSIGACLVAGQDFDRAANVLNKLDETTLQPSEAATLLKTFAGSIFQEKKNPNVLRDVGRLLAELKLTVDAEELLRQYVKEAEPKSPTAVLVLAEFLARSVLDWQQIPPVAFARPMASPEPGKPGRYWHLQFVFEDQPAIPSNLDLFWDL